MTHYTLGKSGGDGIHYNSEEAKKWVYDKRKMSFGFACQKAIGRFIKTFVVKKGYKDGFVGFMVAFFAALYQIMSYARYWELTKGRKP